MSILNPDLKSRPVRSAAHAALLRQAIEDGQFAAVLLMFNTDFSNSHPELGSGPAKLEKNKTYMKARGIAAQREYMRLVRADVLRQAREQVANLRAQMEKFGFEVPKAPFEED